MGNGISVTTKWKMLFNSMNNIIKNMQHKYNQKEGNIEEQDLTETLDYIEETEKTIRHFGEAYKQHE